MQKFFNFLIVGMVFIALQVSTAEAQMAAPTGAGPVLTIGDPLCTVAPDLRDPGCPNAITPPTGAPTMAPPTGAPTMAPPTMADSAAKPTLGERVKSFFGMGSEDAQPPTMAPPTGAPTMAPPTGAPTMAPPTGAPTMAPPTGAPTMAPPTGAP